MHIKQPSGTLVPNRSNDPDDRRFRRVKAVRTLSLAAIVACSFVVTGCQSCVNGIRYNRFCDRLISEKIACFEAKRAWWSYRSRCGGDCLGDAKRGFIAGYKSCAMGSDCRSPIMPERRYWSTWYQSGYGQQKINAWYEGYPMGVAAARVKGHGYHLRTPVTEEVSAYYAATSPMAMQESRIAQYDQANVSQHQQSVRTVQPQASLQGTGTRNRDTQPVPPARNYQATRQPTVREYLDLPSDTAELEAPNYADPFLDSIDSNSEAVNKFQEEATSTAADFGQSIEDGGQQVNQIADDFPAALRPGRN